MRSPNNSTVASSPPAAAADGFRHWNSPIPYLFGGVALMLGLITVALVILACTNRKSSDSSDSRTPNSSSSSAAATAAEADPEKPAPLVDVLVDSYEPKIVVIMAGDDKPTYLAKPVMCSNRNHDHDHHGEDHREEQAVPEISSSNESLASSI